MKNAPNAMLSATSSALPVPDGFPDADALAALRAWYEGLSSRDAVARYLGEARAAGESSRGVVGKIRQALVDLARRLQRPDLVELLAHPAAQRGEYGKAVARAIDTLRTLPAPRPQISDDIARWLPARAVGALREHGIDTLSDLTVRIPRRRRWWAAVPGLGVASARKVEAFFAAYPELTERARVLVARAEPGPIVPWEQLKLPHEVDGTLGTFRAPGETCTLGAGNDYEAVHAWLSLHESPATQRAYRKEAERLMLWAIVERRRPLSSLTTEDAIAYRGFLRQPSPRSRWVGPGRPRTSPEWRPFSGGLSPRSAAYALSVLGALFRWLIAQRYVLANPFAGVKVRGGTRAAAFDTAHVFTEGEWMLVRTIANGLEWSCAWQAPAAQRLRFLLDFSYATGLRASELVSATLGAIETDGQGDHWINLVGKGAKAGKVALPPLARMALERYLVERGLPISRTLWEPRTPLIGALGLDQEIPAGAGSGITGTRLWAVMRRFFAQAAQVLEADNPGLAAKLGDASPHWMRHTHASHALARGAELTTVRDNLRHASISTTSIYLHGDDVKRARQMSDAFGAD